MRLTEEERNMREGLRSQTQRKATELMNLILVEQNAAAARGDHEQFRYFQEQIKAVAESSTAADYQAVDRAVIAWNQMQEKKQSAANEALAAKAPLSNPQEILTRAHQKKADEQRALKQRLTEHLKR